MSQTTSEATRSLSSGLVIAGAYADKIRRTLFAQLKDLVKQDKSFSKEVARAIGELNAVLFRILVEELKIEKGDVVRIRINYNVDPNTKKVIWDYSSLRIEVFKRVPDETVSRIVEDVLKNKLAALIEEFAKAPVAIEEKVAAFSAPEGKEEEVPASKVEKPAPSTPLPQPQPLPAPPVTLTIRDIVSSADVLGETIDGGLLLKLNDKKEQPIGLASITPRGDELVIDAIIIYEGIARRYIGKSRGKLSDYDENPSRIIDDLANITPTEIPRDKADELIREKMQSLY